MPFYRVIWAEYGLSRCQWAHSSIHSLPAHCMAHSFHLWVEYGHIWAPPIPIPLEWAGPPLAHSIPSHYGLLWAEHRAVGGAALLLVPAAALCQRGFLWGDRNFLSPWHPAATSEHPRHLCDALQQPWRRCKGVCRPTAEPHASRGRWAARGRCQLRLSTPRAQRSSCGKPARAQQRARPDRCQVRSAVICAASQRPCSFVREPNGGRPVAVAAGRRLPLPPPQPPGGAQAAPPALLPPVGRLSHQHLVALLPAVGPFLSRSAHVCPLEMQTNHLGPWGRDHSAPTALRS